MGALLDQVSLTNIFQNSMNLVFGVKNQHPHVSLSVCHLSYYQNPLRSRSISSCQVKYCIRTGFDYSSPRNRFVKPVAAFTTDIELEVTVRSASLVVPAVMEGSNNVRRTMFLSNIDQAANMSAAGVLFYSCHPNFTPEVITNKLEAAFRRILVHYDFLAGRLRWNPQRGRLEIDCNSAGAGFVTASSKLSLADIGDLVCPRRGFDQLSIRNWDNLCLKDQPLFVLQVTSFKCGGIAIGINLNHTTLDGIGFQIFLQHLACLAWDNHHDLPYMPCNNRHLLDARSPPNVTQPHVELIDLAQNTSIGQEDEYHPTPPVLSFVPKCDHLQPKVLLLSAENIANLKEKAMVVLDNNTKLSITFSSGLKLLTTFNIVTSYVWQCMALAKYNEHDKDEEKAKATVITFPIDIRSRLRPRLPATYIGNAVINGYAKATYRELEEKPLLYLVDRVAEGVRRVNDEYVRSVIDWRELHSGYVHGDVFLTPWWKLGYSNVEFPWGKAKCYCPLVPQWSNVVTLLEDIRDVRYKGVNVFVSLPSKELDKFQQLFYKSLY